MLYIDNEYYKYDSDKRLWFFEQSRIEALLQLALEDKVPNGEYGDAECSLWQLMARIVRKHERGDRLNG